MTPSSAVFISYASEDRAVARGLEAALLAAGVVVWLDHSELRGGDAWDRSIRTQIRDCTLFLPIISQTTERRREGYFRLEWRLADQRTHLMGRTKAFIVPVCVDEINEARADVPDSFLEVHWTRLPGGVPTPEFVERVKGLLAGFQEPIASGGSAPPNVRADARSAPAGVPRTEPGAGYFNRWIALAAAAAVLVGGGIWLWPRVELVAPGAVEVDRSIAVLPFSDLSAEGNRSTFADGMHVDLRTNLGLFKELTVVGSTSVEQYRNTTKSAREIGEELEVAYILAGSVRRDEDRVKVTAELVETRNDRVVWTRPYDAAATDLFSLQAKIAEEIAAALNTTISTDDKSRLERKSPGNLNAYSVYHAVREASSREVQTRAWLASGISDLEAVLEAEPDFAEAWSLLAVLHTRHVALYFDTSAARRAAAKEAVDKAVEHNPEGPETIRCLGLYQAYVLRDFAAAELNYRKLAGLLGNGDPAGYLGALQARQGKWTEALPNLRQAAQLEPGNLSHGRALEALYVAGRLHRDALVLRLRLAGLHPNSLEDGFQAGLVEFRGSGNRRLGDEFIARLSAEQKESPEGLSLQLRWARATGDLATALRLDRDQPHFAEDGSPPWQQALAAAAVLAATGDRAAARTRLSGVPAALQATLLDQPENPVVRQALALALAVTDDREEALAEARKAIELVPPGTDASGLAQARHTLAVVQAWAGDRTAALAELTAILKAPFAPVTVHSLKVDPWWAPLRGSAEFEALLADPALAAPLFQVAPEGRGREGREGRGQGGLGARGGGGGARPGPPRGALQPGAGGRAGP